MVGAQALKLSWEHPIFSEVITDQEAVAAIEKFVGTCPGKNTVAVPMGYLGTPFIPNSLPSPVPTS